jgi:hypothetical protein
MAELKRILSHADWSSFKKQQKQDRFSVSGVDLGASLDAYRAAVKPGLKNLAASIAAAHTLHETLTKYVGKMPKDAKRPKAFDDGVIAIRDNAKHNLDALTAEQHEVAQFAQALQRFHTEVIRLCTSPDLSKLEEIKKDQLLPPLMALARKLEIDEAAADDVVAFKRTCTEIARQTAAKNNAVALGEVPDLRIHATKIFQNLQTALNA